MAFPGCAGRLVARAHRAARRRLGRVRRGDRRSAAAALGTDGGRLLRGGRRRPVPHRRRQPDAVRRARVRARGLRRLPAPAAEGLRRLGGGLARAAPDLSGGAAAADVPATLPRRAVPDLHVAGAVVRGAPRDRARGGGIGRRAGSLHRTVRELALDLVKPAVLLDALGTLVELQPPAPRLRHKLAEEGFEVSEERAAAGFAAEISYYLEHHLEGSDRQRLEDLRDRCATAMMEALELPGLDHATARRAMLGALEFTPYPDAVEALRELRRAGRALVVVSNWDCSLPDWLEPTGLLELVDRVVTSADVGAAKPDAAIFRRALELA